VEGVVADKSSCSLVTKASFILNLLCAQVLDKTVTARKCLLRVGYSSFACFGLVVELGFSFMAG